MRAADTLGNATQNPNFKFSQNLSEHLKESILLPGLDSKREYIKIRDTYLMYSAADCLFDDLMAVAEYPQVK